MSRGMPFLLMRAMSSSSLTREPEPFLPVRISRAHCLAFSMKSSMPHLLDNTQADLLDAGGEPFEQRGFKGVWFSIRQPANDFSVFSAVGALLLFMHEIASFAVVTLTALNAVTFTVRRV